MNSIIIDKNDGEKMWNDVVSFHKEMIEIVLSKMRPLYSKYLSLIFVLQTKIAENSTS